MRSRSAVGTTRRFLQIANRTSSRAALPNREELRTLLLDCLRSTEHWIASPPTDRDEDVLMKRVLELHVEVTKLERRALLAVVKGSTAIPSGYSTE
jgi:hypothetical protein